MKKTNPDAWLGLFLLIVLVITPLVVGILLTKIFRLFCPLNDKEVKPAGLNDIGKTTGDSFYLMALVGWMICGPIYFWFYQYGF